MSQDIQHDGSKKDGSKIVSLTYRSKMIAQQYQKILKHELTQATYLFLVLLVGISASGWDPTTHQTSQARTPSPIPGVPAFTYFTLADLNNGETASLADQKRFGLEELFQDFKRGGYNLEGSNLGMEQLSNLLIVVSIADTSAMLKGQEIKRMSIQK